MPNFMKLTDDYRVIEETKRDDEEQSEEYESEDDNTSYDDETESEEDIHYEYTVGYTYQRENNEITYGSTVKRSNVLDHNLKDG